MNLAFLGVTAGIVEFIGMIPYVVDIFRCKTKPERVSFWIFCLLNSIAFAAQVADGWSWSIVLIGLSVLTSALIALLSLKYGYGNVKLKDLVSVAVAITGVIIWIISDTPLIAIGMVILVDLAGFWLIIVKSWEAPQTETFISWVATAFSTTLAAISVGRFDLVQISYVLYSAIGCWGMVLLLIYRRHKLQPKIEISP